MSDLAAADDGFDRILIEAAFAIAGRTGWGRVSVADAAAEAGLPLARARARFPARIAILLRLGLLADQAALTDIPADGSPRDRLFDMLMRRIDVLQSHREGVLALLRYLPTDLPLALLLSRSTKRSMRWMLEGAGLNARGVRGELATNGLVAVWLWAVRAWRTDDSPDLPATMSALDKALTRAEQAAEWLDGRGRRPLDDVSDASPLDVPMAEAPPDVPAPEVPEVPPSEVLGTDVPPEEPGLPAAPSDTPPDAPPSPPGVM